MAQRFASPSLLVLAAVLSGSTAPRPDHAYFEAHLGQVVAVVGQRAVVPWQHLTRGVPGKVLEYVDLDGGHQIVAHFDARPACGGSIAIEGRVFEVRGPSKDAIRGTPGMEDDEFWEYAVDVLGWRCL